MLIGPGSIRMLLNYNILSVLGEHGVERKRKAISDVGKMVSNRAFKFLLL